MLRSETNTPKIERAIMSAAAMKLNQLHHHLSTDFEHGHWWVTCLDCGAQWDAVDCLTRYGAIKTQGEDYFDFEEVSHGDEHCQNEANRIARARERGA